MYIYTNVYIYLAMFSAWLSKYDMVLCALHSTKVSFAGRGGSTGYAKDAEYLGYSVTYIYIYIYFVFCFFVVCFLFLYTDI